MVHMVSIKRPADHPSRFLISRAEESKTLPPRVAWNITMIGHQYGIKNLAVIIFILSNSSLRPLLSSILLAGNQSLEIKK